VADGLTNWIHQIRPNGSAAPFYASKSPRGMIYEPATGQLLVACGLDFGYYFPLGYASIQVVQANGTASTLPIHLPGEATPSGMIVPENMAFGPDGALYVTEWSNARVSRIAPDGTVAVVVGGSGKGSGGDGGPAGQAQLAGPTGIAFDSIGQMYIADSLGNRIRRVALNGIISTFAGAGQQGFSGDGGPASAAEFAWPAQILFDANGDLLVADYLNGRVRRIGTDGVVTTIAGSGATPPSTPVGWAPLPAPTTLAQEPPPMPASSAFLLLPSGIAVDSGGTVYVLEGPERRIRRITPDGLISTVAVLPRAVNVGALAIDSAGRLYVAESFLSQTQLFSAGGQVNEHLHGGVVGRVDPDGTYTIVAGQPGNPGYNGDNQPAVNALLDAPNSLATDSAGNLFILEYGNLRVRKVDTNGTITTVTGPSQIEQLSGGEPGVGYSSAIAVDPSGRLYVAVESLFGNGPAQVDLVNADGSLTKVAGFGFVSGLAFRPTDEMVVFDYSLGYLWEIGQDGAMRQIAGYSTRQSPDSVYCFLGDGAAAADACIGDFIGTNISQLAELFYPYPPGVTPQPSIALDSAGNVYFSQSLGEMGGEIRVLGAAPISPPSIR